MDHEQSDDATTTAGAEKPMAEAAAALEKTDLEQ